MRFGLENYSSLRQWAGVPLLIENEVKEASETLEGYQKLGLYEETDLDNKKHTFTLWKKNENSLLKWVRVATMIIATFTLIIPIIAFLSSLKSDYVNALLPDRIYKKEISIKSSNIQNIPSPEMNLSSFSLLISSNSNRSTYLRSSSHQNQNIPGKGINESRNLLPSSSSLTSNPSVLTAKIPKVGLDSIETSYKSAIQALGKELDNRLGKDCYLLDFDLLHTHLQFYPKEVKILLKRWYGDIFIKKLEEIFSKFNLSEDYYLLFLQPGIASHIKEFNQFLKNQKSIPLSPKMLREMFSKYLGSQVFYRAMYLSKKDTEKFQNKAQPIFNLVHLRKDSYSRYSTIFEALGRLDGSTYEKASVIENSMMDQYTETTKSYHAWRGHRADGGLGSPFIPISKYRDLSNNVAYWLSRKNGQKEPIILKLEIPIIETVGCQGSFFLEAIANGELSLFNEKNIQTSIPKNQCEHLVYGNIPSTCIQEVSSGYVSTKKYTRSEVEKDDPLYVTYKSHFDSIC